MKGPAYETKLAALSTSPTITVTSYFNLTIDSPHLTFSEPKALTNLWAKSSLLVHLSASA